MLDKKYRTIDDYKKAGAKMRLFKYLGVMLYSDLIKIMNKSDLKIFSQVQDRTEAVCSRAEDNMFDDFPDISDDYLNVFYGHIDSSLRDEIDEEINKLAKKVYDETFK